MRFILIGFLSFFTWSAVSTYYYVCKIKHFCNDREMIQVDAISIKPVFVTDSITTPGLQKMAEIPGVLTVNFAFDKYEFTPDGSTDNYFDRSKEYIEQNSEVNLAITGYTDAIGSEQYNQALGYRRAQTMQDYFERKGLPAAKITIESKGEKEPVGDNSTDKGRANNRRTVITINK
jgi:outer membrane protein OmpA-like peptidoglycan-associated protein